MQVLSENDKTRIPSPEAVIALVSNVSPKTRQGLSESAGKLLASMTSARDARHAKHSDREKTPEQMVEEQAAGTFSVLETKAMPPPPMPRPDEKKKLPKENQKDESAPAPTDEPSNQDVTSLIDGIKRGIVDPKLRDLRLSFSINIAYYVVLLSAGILVNLYPTSLTAIGTLGLGSLGVGVNYNNLKNAVTNYLNAKENLQGAIEELELLKGPHRNFPYSGGAAGAYTAAEAFLKTLNSPSPASNQPTT